MNRVDLELRDLIQRSNRLHNRQPTTSCGRFEETHPLKLPTDNQHPCPHALPGLLPRRTLKVPFAVPNEHLAQSTQTTALLLIEHRELEP